jgi:hypothetical protein
MTTAEDLVTCDECEAGIPEAVYDAGDGLCPTCLAKTFTCEECSERVSKADAHPDILGMCASCGDSAVEAQHEERLDAAAETLRELVESLIDSGKLDVMAQAITSLKALKSPKKPSK